MHKSQKQPHNPRTHYKVTTIYLIAASLWIIFSDFLLFDGSLPGDILSLSTLKGLFFVLFTATVLFFVLQREYRQKRSYEMQLRKENEFQRAINQASPLPMICLDRQGTVLSWNDAATRVFGWSHDEMTGKSYPLVPESEQQQFTEVRNRVLQGESVSNVEVLRRCKDGATLSCSLFTAPVHGEDGRVEGIMSVLEDISERKESEQLIQKLNRLYTVLSEVNQAIVRLRDQQELFDEACRIAVDDGGFLVAWIGMLDQQGQSLQPVSVRGDSSEFVENTHFSLNDPPEQRVGPVYTALQQGVHGVVSDVATDPQAAPRRDQALRCGFRSSAAFPLQVFGDVRGVFVLYAAEPGFFDADEIRLLDELAKDLSLGMEMAEKEAERQKAEKLLQESESRYRSLFENNHAVMLLIDPKSGDIVDANPAACAFYGWSRQEMQQLNIDQINTLDRDEIKARMAKALSLGKNHFVFKHRQKNGSVRDVEAYSGPLMLEKRQLLYSLVFDITERIQAEEALVEAKKKAEAGNKVKSEFLANMSHELRTPLNGIMGLMQVLQTSDINEEQSELVSTAIQSSKRLTRLLSDILDISQTETGALAFRRDVFDLYDLLREVKELFEPVEHNSEVSFEYSIDDGVPRQLVGDASRLLQILANFVGNSFKFTNKGSISLHIHALQGLSEDAFRLLFIVSDTGIGIPQERLNTLFQPFSQASEGYRRKYQGAGLGLTICKRLIEGMGGSLAVDSQENAGTTIYFSLPFPGQQDQQRDHATTAESSTVPFSVHVLFAEDDTVNRLSTTKLLEKHGCTVTAVANGREAFDLLAHNERFDLALLDIQMPVMDGLELTRRIRNGETGADNASLPIVAVTAYAMDSDKKKFLAAGMDDHLAKPLSIGELKETIARVMS